MTERVKVSQNALELSDARITVPAVRFWTFVRASLSS